MATSIASTRNDSRERDAADALKVGRSGARESQEAWHRTCTIHINYVLVDFGCRDRSRLVALFFFSFFFFLCLAELLFVRLFGWLVDWLIELVN